MYRPTANGYFSGAGLMEIGLMQAGIELKQSLDLDTHAVESMRRNPQYFNHTILQRDIKDILVKEQYDADMIVGTYPCNHYSPIADLFGSRTGDDLFLHFFRHIAIKQPEMYIVENVPGMKKFHVVMEAMTQLPGYYVNVFCPVDAACWLPQRRERLILVGTKKPFTIAAPRPAKKVPTIKDILEKDPVIEVNETVIARLNGEYRDKPIVVDPDNPKSIAPTCVAHYAKDMGTRLVKDKKYPHGVRPFTVREYARLQGVPDDYIFPDNRYAYKLIGNGVPVPMGRHFGFEAVKYFNRRSAA